ncbi:DNA polymerase [Streptomyces sp. NPDC004732]|uniref:DNA polymerase n=1 Tax=Streptomyces sp. NPDC004732 TaxID=3154290 RepID=UPI0033B30244
MIEFCTRLKGDVILTHVVETVDDLEGFRAFIKANRRVIGFDTETTGLDIYAAEGFRVRLAQFGNAVESWIIPLDREWDGYDKQFAADVVGALRYVEKLVTQNGKFDVLVSDEHLDITAEELFPKLLDSQVLAKLIDSRPAEKGGFGHSLEELTIKFIDREVGEKIKGSMKVLAKAYKTTKEKIWSKVDLWDPTYLTYAAFDPCLAFRLARILTRKVPASARPLIRFEHEVVEVCGYMERAGFLLDEPYTRGLREDLMRKEADWVEKARVMGVENINSTDQCADAFERRGVFIKGRTPSGKRKVDKNFLKERVDAGDELASAIVEGKRAGKWRKTWIDSFLDGMDANGRCHAGINTLQARTGRMSITGIPAQTLPSGDWMIRRCFVAEEDHVILSTDFSNMELRVLAAASGDKRMLKAFRDGEDLHQITADAAGVDRKAGKGTNFTVCFGGGWKAVVEQYGVSEEMARKAVDAFWETYPGVKAFADKLQKEARRNGYITTASGRRLMVDKDRPYAALNYYIQSSARDITCRALLRMHKAQLTRFMRLPIHDEVVFSVPKQHAEKAAKMTAELMQEVFKGLIVPTDPEVGLRSWGSLYGADA